MLSRNQLIITIFLLISSITVLDAQNCYGYRDTSFNQTGYWLYDSSDASSGIYDLIKTNEKLYTTYVANSRVRIKAYDFIDTAANNISNQLLYVDSNAQISYINDYNIKLHELSDSSVLLTSENFVYEFFELFAFNSNLEPETNFGIGGTTIIQITPYDSYGTIRTSKNDGIYIPYYNTNSTGVIKYDINGFPDLTFNGGISNISLSGDIKIDRVEIYNDSLGIAIGLHEGGTVSNEIFLYFFNKNTGLPDTSLIGTAYKFLPISFVAYSIEDAKYDSFSQSLFVSCQISGHNGIVRLNSLFDLDLGFAGVGLHEATSYLNFNEIILSSGGRFFTDFGTGYAYYNNDATLETSFGMGGFINLGLDSLNEYFANIKDLFFDADLEKAYIIGNSDNVISPDHDIIIVRLNVNSCFMGIEENNDFNLVIYPNPTNDILCFEAQDIINTRIYDLFGREYNRNRASNECLDVSNLPSGMYNLVIDFKNHKRSIHKFIKYE